MSELVLRSRQRARKIDLALLRRITEEVLRGLHDGPGEIAIHLVDAKRMASINEQFLQHEGSTDVITFDYAEYEKDETKGSTLSGEIFISVPDAVEQAEEFGTSWQSEVARYVIHGLLHLKGYDDLEPSARRLMKREETRWVRRITKLFPVDQLGKEPARAARPAPRRER